MKMKLNKKYMAIDASAGGAGGVAKDFDYAQVEAALNSIQANISSILAALDTPINVTSYQGDAQGEVEAAINKIRPYLAQMKEPLNQMTDKITEVKEAYAKGEASIKSSLSGIGS